MGKPATSCLSCRKSRLGCNGQQQAGKGCSNCIRKGLPCSLPPAAVKRRPSTATVNFRHSITHGLGLSDTLARAKQSEGMHVQLWQVFRTVLEPTISSLGVYNIEVYSTNSGDIMKCLPISQLMTRLDESLNTLSPTKSPGQVNETSYIMGNSQEIENALNIAVYAYAIHWIYVTKNELDPKSRQAKNSSSFQKDLQDKLWQQAQKQMYYLLSRPSYRAILALHLFSNIPSSCYQDRTEFADHCLQVSLKHLDYLSTRQQPTRVHDDPALALLEDNSIRSKHITATQSPAKSPDCSNIEPNPQDNSAYWFGITSDITRSLTKCRTPILSYTRNNEAKLWATVRQRAEAFVQHYNSSQDDTGCISNDQAITILREANNLMTVVCATIIHVQDSHILQNSTTSAMAAIDVSYTTYRQFEGLFEPLLTICQRDFMFLRSNAQTYYVLLVIHMQLGPFVLADVSLSLSGSIDSRFDSARLRLCACRNVVAALAIALQASSCGADQSLVSNILLLDPYPDKLANIIIRAGSSLVTLYKTQTVSAEPLHRMMRLVIEALDMLASSSYIASKALPLLQQMVSDSEMTSNTAAARETSTCGSAPSDDGINIPEGYVTDIDTGSASPIGLLELLPTDDTTKGIFDIDDLNIFVCEAEPLPDSTTEGSGDFAIIDQSLCDTSSPDILLPSSIF